MILNQLREELNGDDYLMYIKKVENDTEASKCDSLLTKLINDDSAKGVTALLYNYYRRLFLTLASKHLQDDNLARILGVKPYAINIYRTQAKALGSEKILNSMNMLTKIDTATKSSFTSLNEELYLFLFYTLS